MRRITLALATLVALAGAACTTWAIPEHLTQADLDEDLYHCRYAARMIPTHQTPPLAYPRTLTDGNDPSAVLVNSLNGLTDVLVTAMVQIGMEKQCMHARGWREQ